MVYITTRQPRRHRQIELDELMDGLEDLTNHVIPANANTITHRVEKPNQRILSRIDVGHLIDKLHWFNNTFEYLYNKERQSLYYTFDIPKRSGGLREINAPNQELSAALRMLKAIFEYDFFALYHTSAFAYMPGRCTLDCVKKHQQMESKAFLKLDFSNFFGSTTLQFAVNQLSMIFPFSEVMKIQEGREALEKALDLCFLNGGLPMGTPISPMLTNILMIPIDHLFANKLRKHENHSFVYTRYADDIIISSKHYFKQKVDLIGPYVKSVLNKFNAPYILNEEKTVYKTNAGKNFILGVMLNKHNEITVGHKNKDRFRAMLFNYTRDYNKKKFWSLYDIQKLHGHIGWYRSVEQDHIDELIREYSARSGVDIEKTIAYALKYGKAG